MKLKKTFTIISLLIFPVLLYSQVAINENADPADASAILDINSSNKGVLVPRHEIPNFDNALNPVENPANGLIIYNTGSVIVSEGLYMWSSSEAEWVELLTSKNANIVNITSDGWGGYNMQWGGELELGSWAVFGGDAGHGKQRVSDWSTVGIVPKDGDIQFFAWSSERGDNTSVVAMIINGVTTTFPLPGAEGYYEFPTPIPVSKGDGIEFKCASGKEPFHTGLTIYIE